MEGIFVGFLISRRFLLLLFLVVHVRVRPIYDLQFMLCYKVYRISVLSLDQCA